MAGRQLGFEFARPPRPSVASAELAAAHARRASAARMHLDEHLDSAGERQAPPEVPKAPSHRAAPPPEPPTPNRSPRELASTLELWLRARCGDALRLTVTDNRRTMVSLRRHNHGKHGERIEIRVHHMFLHAEQEIWAALSDYLFSGDRDAATRIGRYIEQHREHIRRLERRPLALRSTGEHHDLSAICRDVNERYFGGEAQVDITWSRENGARAGRRSIKLGSYTSRDRLIRVHPALDAAFVPRYFVEYIVYHELLHHMLPPKLHNGRRQLHGPAFQAREREFRDYQAALRWERENLDKLLQTHARRASTNQRGNR